MVTRLFLVVVLLLPFAAHSAVEYAGKVVGISNGDTIRVLHKKRQLKIRLAEIDTPEKGQPYGKRAKQALSALVFGKEIKFIKQTMDHYGRIVARVYVDGLDVNSEMVRQGHAWVYRKYAKDPILYRLEGEAREAKRGLWALPEAQRVPPWVWRNFTRERKMTPRPKLHPPPYRCGTKQFCSEMLSCEEAMFHLMECGLKRLDGDRDGVPCEALCSEVWIP